jgi:hypothetical protein
LAIFNGVLGIFKNLIEILDDLLVGILHATVAEGVGLVLMLRLLHVDDVFRRVSHSVALLLEVHMVLSLNLNAVDVRNQSCLRMLYLQLAGILPLTLWGNEVLKLDLSLLQFTCFYVENLLLADLGFLHELLDLFFASGPREMLVLELAGRAVLRELNMLPLDLQHKIVVLRGVVAQDAHSAVSSERGLFLDMATCSGFWRLRYFGKLLLHEHVLLLTPLCVVLANLFRAAQLPRQRVFLHHELRGLLPLFQDTLVLAPF